MGTVNCQLYKEGTLVNATIKKTRKKLSLTEQKEKIAADEAKIAQQKSKIAVAELKDYVSNLKVANVGILFTVVKANKAGVKDIDILLTLAEIAKLKVNISPKVAAKRVKKAATK